MKTTEMYYKVISYNPEYSYIGTTIEVSSDPNYLNDSIDDWCDAIDDLSEELSPKYEVGELQECIAEVCYSGDRYEELVPVEDIEQEIQTKFPNWKHGNW